jgi:hypothetical protein
MRGIREFGAMWAMGTGAFEGRVACRDGPMRMGHFLLF